MARIRMLTVLLLVFMLVTPALFAGDKHPERKVRDAYAKHFAAEVEHDGWEMSAWAMRPGCPMVCVNHGEHNCLRLFWDGGTVEAVDRFMAQEIQPRSAKLRELGFVQVDILGLSPSNSYPNGRAQFTLAPSQ